MVSMTQRSVREAQSGEQRAAPGTSSSVGSRRAVVLTVGDEILRGDIINTNAAYLSEQATALGFDVVLHQSVADDIAIIGDVVQRAASLAELVLISGGLGPTTDDLTSEAVAVAFGGSLIRSERAEAQLRVFFEARGREIVAANLKQADLPVGATMLENPIGTAPGFALPVPEGRGSLVVCMPGVPVEMRKMFRERVIPEVSARIGRLEPASRRLYRVLGLGESTVQHRIGGALEALIEGLPQGDVRVQYRAHVPEVWIALQGAPDSEGRFPTAGMLAEADTMMREALGSSLYGIGTATIEERVLAALGHGDLTVAAAESCTGGHVGGLLTSVPGASNHVLGSIVAYSNQLKRSLLDVGDATLREHGAVSEATARAMAQGVCRRTGADIGVAVTGLAGPAADGADGAVGMVHFATSDGETTTHRALQLPGSRARIIKAASYGALRMVWDVLLERGVARVEEAETKFTDRV
jgi:nicotinamide-nucleotide amidase